MDLSLRGGMEVSIPEYNSNSSYAILGDIIDKYLNDSECLVAEALGKMFYDRSLRIFDKRVNGPNENEVACYGSADKYDGSKYGLDYYKYLGYRFVVQSKLMTKQMKEGREEKDTHTWQELLIILYGDQVKNILRNPRAYLFA